MESRIALACKVPDPFQVMESKPYLRRIERIRLEIEGGKLLRRHHIPSTIMEERAAPLG